MFTLRRPMGADEHEVAMSVQMEEQMLHDLTQGMDQFNSSFHGYIAGYAIAERNMAGDLAGHIDTADLPGRIGERVRQTESMLATMAFDGVPAAERQQRYSAAFAQTIDRIRQQHPEFQRDWDAKFGPRWQEQMQDMLKDPKAYYAAEAAAEQDGTAAGPAWEAGREGDAAKPRGPRPGDSPPEFRQEDAPQSASGHDYEP